MNQPPPATDPGAEASDQTGGSVEPRTVAILGAGSWGSALAMQVARCGHRVLLWGRDAGHVEQMRASRSNERFLPGLVFPEGVIAQASLATALDGADDIVIAVPSHGFAAAVDAIRSHGAGREGIAWACKGLEPGTGRFLHEVALERYGPEVPLAVITGPSFAIEVARNLPTAVTVAATDAGYAERIVALLHGSNFRAYTSDDIKGAELGGAVKNVLAVATGICDGLSLGHNARAALITRGLAEMMRLGRALGAQARTLVGLAGMGDLVLTCTGDLSRNRRLGLALGAGTDLDAALTGIGQVVEGVGTAEEVHRLGRQHEVELPISEQVYGIIHKGWNPSEGVRRLLSREPKSETA